MIICKLNGGLGNQLFQYALGRKIAHARGLELRFDLSVLKSGRPDRQYKLDRFRVHGRPANAKELKDFYFMQQIPYLGHIYTIYQDFLPYYRRRIVVEQSADFDANVFSIPTNAVLCGYWQSEKYFHDIRSLLLDEFRLKEPFNEIDQQIYEEICVRNSVSLHIRRGDYIVNPSTNKHGALPMGYYKRAMKMLEETVKSPHYYVFSDEISWARQHLQAPGFTFVDRDNPQHDIFDFALMSTCKHHIIANSSFSWWAAWLSNDPAKQVFAPSRWYKVKKASPDLIPPDWNLI
jgi:hypothetical protein